MQGEELRCRPLVIAFAGLSIGLSAAISWWVLLLVPIGLYLLRDGQSRAIIGVSAALGLLLMPPLLASPVMERGVFEGEARVVSIPRTGGFGVSCEVRADRTYTLLLPAGSDVSLGDRLLILAEVAPLKEHHVRRLGSVGSLEITAPVEVLSQGSSVWRWGLGVRRSFVSFVRSHTDDETGAVISGLCFGQTSGMSSETMLALKRSGTAHIVATSGLHVLLAIAGLAWLLLKLPISRQAQLAILMCVLVVYAGAAGLRAPIIRAIIMAAVLFAAPLVRRSPDGLSAASLAGILSLVIYPSAVANVGFWLSYAAVHGLIMFMPKAENLQKTFRNGGARWILAVGSATVIAFLATAPIVSYFFGELPLFSLASNLLVLPLIPVVIGVSVSAWLLSFAAPSLGGFLIEIVCEPLARLVLQTVHAIGGSSHSVLFIPAFSAVWLLVIYGLTAILWRPKIREA
jgi:competence protein ComEC